MSAVESLLEQRVRLIIEHTDQPKPGLNLAVHSLVILFLVATGIVASINDSTDQATDRWPALSTAEAAIDTIGVNWTPGDPDAITRLGHVDHSAEGFRSIAGSGHVVKFRRDTDLERIVAIEIFASRYGNETPPQEDFHIYLLDGDHKVLAAFPFAYSEIDRGVSRWYTLPIRSTQVPEQFYVAVAFNPHRTKGVYIGFDESANTSNSYTGRPTSKWTQFGAGREWMIRAILAGEGQPKNPFN